MIKIVPDNFNGKFWKIIGLVDHLDNPIFNGQQNIVSIDIEIYKNCNDCDPIKNTIYQEGAFTILPNEKGEIILSPFFVLYNSDDPLIPDPDTDLTIPDGYYKVVFVVKYLKEVECDLFQELETRHTVCVFQRMCLQCAYINWLRGCPEKDTLHEVIMIMNLLTNNSDCLDCCIGNDHYQRLLSIFKESCKDCYEHKKCSEYKKQY